MQWFLPGALFRGLMVLLVTAGQFCYAQAMPPAPDAVKGGDGKAPEVVPSTYKIGAGDVLHITVWEEPQLTETAVVRPDGKVSMPLVTELTVGGLTPEAAQQVLTALRITNRALNDMNRRLAVHNREEK